jgi:hypothetical protein
MARVALTEIVITPAHSTPDLWTDLFIEYRIYALILSFDLDRFAIACVGQFAKLAITHIFCANLMFTFSACGADGRVEPGVERSGTPGI